ncbi:MAG: amidohydrolase family protein [Mycobacterium sp.]
MNDVYATSARLDRIVDCNIHLWDQTLNPVFWLSDRNLLRSMLGDYDSLPDRYTVDDYREATSGLAIDGAVWSDPGTADPLAAIDWVRNQDDHGLLVGLVTLADPDDPSFASLVDQVRDIDLVTAIRIRLTDSFGSTGTARAPDNHLDSLGAALQLVHEAGLVAVIESSPGQLGVVTDLARRLPDLRMVVDHFGWPDDLSATGRRIHLARLAPLAARPNVATRIDAIGTIFGSWTTEAIRPWLEGVVDLFGAERCMLGSDLPIETLRSTFSQLYRAYHEVFAGRFADERAQLLSATAVDWLGAPRVSA